MATSAERWAKSTKTRSDYARERRNALVRVIAQPVMMEGITGLFHCTKCRQHFADSELEIDHINGITWNPRAKSSWSRTAMYWREHRQGVPLRALCRSCNAADGARRRWAERATSTP